MPTTPVGVDPTHLPDLDPAVVLANLPVAGEQLGYFEAASVAVEFAVLWSDPAEQLTVATRSLTRQLGHPATVALVQRAEHLSFSLQEAG